MKEVTYWLRGVPILNGCRVVGVMVLHDKLDGTYKALGLKILR